MYHRPSPYVPAELLERLTALLPGEPREIGRLVRRLSDAYVSEQAHAGAALGGADLARAYGRYYLPVNYPKLAPILGELAAFGRTDLATRERLRVFDPGSGPATFSLALVGYLAERGQAPESIEIVLMDSEPEMLRLGRELLEWWAAKRLPQTEFRIVTRTASFDEPLPQEDVRGVGFDLIVAGNAMAEWGRELPKTERTRRITDLFEGWGGSLAPEGALVIIEPALKQTSRALHAVRDEVLARKRLSVFAPCLHTGPCPVFARPRDWCHERLLWELPAELEAIDAHAGLEKRALAFSYLVLRNEPCSLRDAFAGRESRQRGRVISDTLSEKGKTGVVACTEAGERVYFEALRRKPPETYERLASLVRGTIARFPPGRPAGHRRRLSPEEPPEPLGEESS